MEGIELILGGVFGAVILAFLIVDLGFFDRRAHKVSFRSALYQSIFWVAVSVVFGALVYFLEDRESAYQFFSVYLTEKILSVDNLFVILLIFAHFNIDEKYHHKVLFWGILGAIVMRAIFIGAGSYLVGQFHWILYIFGAILLYSGVKLFLQKASHHVDMAKSKLVRFLHRYLPITTAEHHGKFMTLERGRRVFTTLFLALLVVEFTDLIFAVDSIPAAFAITSRPFIIYTANIFALMGLRAMFFLLENIMHRFHLLSKALSFILIFIGAKMFSGVFGIHVSSGISFGIIIAALTLSIVLSLVYPKAKETVL